MQKLHGDTSLQLQFYEGWGQSTEFDDSLGYKKGRKKGGEGKGNKERW